jgi:Flp pilus assembly protein TadD
LTWQKAIDLEPLCSEAFFNSGYVSFLENWNEAAISFLSESLRLRGRDSEAIFLRGKVYERLGRREDSQRATAQAVRLSQRLERWLSQPIPKLERVRPSTSFRKPDEIWTAQRLARRAKGQDVDSWLEAIQTEIDANHYGEAIRELETVLRVYPSSTEARALLEEVNARRNRR